MHVASPVLGTRSWQCLLYSSLAGPEEEDQVVLRQSLSMESYHWRLHGWTFAMRTKKWAGVLSRIFGNELRAIAKYEWLQEETAKRCGEQEDCTKTAKVVGDVKWILPKESITKIVVRQSLKHCCLLQREMRDGDDPAFLRGQHDFIFRIHPRDFVFIIVLLYHEGSIFLSSWPGSIRFESIGSVLPHTLGDR